MSRTPVPTTMPMESEKVGAIPIATPPAVFSLGKGVNLVERPCRKSPEGSPASTSPTSTSIQLEQERCPVSGRPIPPLWVIEKEIDESLTLSNWCWPRSVAVKGIALALRRWALEVGLEKAAERGRVIFELAPLKYADLANLPWVPSADYEALAPEILADRLGGIVDELETRSGAEGSSGPGDVGEDQRLLSSSGTAPESDSGGGEPVHDGSERADILGDEGPDGGATILSLSARRGRRPDGLSRRQVAEELEEHQQDLRAFNNAYQAVHARVQEVKDEGRMMKLVNWSGTAAVMGSLEIAIHMIEGVISDLKSILQRIDDGVIENLDG